MPRIHTPQTLSADSEIALDAAAARHVQVLRMQPGMTLTLFNGQGGQWQAEVTHMGRNDVRVKVLAHEPAEREAARELHIAVGMPANERMEWLVEKATELGVASIQPLMTERSVLRLSGERAEKKVAHWQAVAIAACEQCGRNRVPTVQAVQTLDAFVKSAPAAAHRYVLSLRESSQALHELRAQSVPMLTVSGPEGGLSAAEEDALIAAGFAPLSLGPRVLRAETAPIAILSSLLLV
jgi:16S rRNA (uracil1498-N3)-methyltransferase